MKYRNFSKRQQTWARAIKKMRYCGEFREFSKFLRSVMVANQPVNCPSSAVILETLADAAEQIAEATYEKQTLEDIEERMRATA